MRGSKLLAYVGVLHSFMHWDGRLLTIRRSSISSTAIVLLETGFRWFTNCLCGETLGSDGRRGEVLIASRSQSNVIGTGEIHRNSEYHRYDVML